MLVDTVFFNPLIFKHSIELKNKKT